MAACHQPWFLDMTGLLDIARGVALYLASFDEKPCWDSQGDGVIRATSSILLLSR